MDKKKLLIIAGLLVFLFCLSFGVYYYLRLQDMVRPSWLALGAYVKYAQVFQWDESNATEYMTWNLTAVGDASVDLRLLSHGVNLTSGNVAIVSGEANWTIDAYTREITGSSDANYVGEKCPFWIRENANAGSTVDTLYGVATIGASESVDVLGRQRDCWVLEYNWPTSSMKRWYDKPTGICLKIQVTIHRQDTTISTTETAVLTNIELKP
jgi:hypothetical protein